MEERQSIVDTKSSYIKQIFRWIRDCIKDHLIKINTEVTGLDKMFDYTEYLTSKFIKSHTEFKADEWTVIASAFAELGLRSCVQGELDSIDWNEYSRGSISHGLMLSWKQDIIEYLDSVGLYLPCTEQVSSPLVKSKCVVKSHPSKRKQLQEQVERDNLFLNYLDVVKAVDKITGDSYIPVVGLGSGVQGNVNMVCVDDCNKCVAVKIQIYTSICETEAKMQSEFANLGIGIPIMGWEKIKTGQPIDYFIMVMPVFDHTFADVLTKKLNPAYLDKYVKRIDYILGVMKDHGLVHGDMHFWNLGVYRGELYLLDFGRSGHLKGGNMFIEYTQIVRSVFIHDKINLDNRIYLLKKYVPMFRSEFVNAISKGNDPDLPSIDIIDLTLDSMTIVSAYLDTKNLKELGLYKGMQEYTHKKDIRVDLLMKKLEQE